MTISRYILLLLLSQILDALPTNTTAHPIDVDGDTDGSRWRHHNGTNGDNDAWKNHNTNNGIGPAGLFGIIALVCFVVGIGFASVGTRTKCRTAAAADDEPYEGREEDVREEDEPRLVDNCEMVMVPPPTYHEAVAAGSVDGRLSYEDDGRPSYGEIIGGNDGRPSYMDAVHMRDGEAARQ